MITAFYKLHSAFNSISFPFPLNFIVQWISQGTHRSLVVVISVFFMFIIECVIITRSNRTADKTIYSNGIIYFNGLHAHTHNNNYFLGRYESLFTWILLRFCGTINVCVEKILHWAYTLLQSCWALSCAYWNTDYLLFLPLRMRHLYHYSLKKIKLEIKQLFLICI